MLLQSWFLFLDQFKFASRGVNIEVPVKFDKMRCYVLSCGVKRGEVESDVLFFSFPKDLELQKVWIKFTQRTDPFLIKSARICSAHFLPAIDYKTGYFDLPCGFRLLKDDAAPRKNPQQDFEMMEMQMKEEAAARVKILL